MPTHTPMLAARQAGMWQEIGEEVVFGYTVDSKTGDQIATGLRLTGPRQAAPPEPSRRGFFG